MKTGREFWALVALAAVLGGLGLVLSLRASAPERLGAVAFEAAVPQQELLAAVSELGYTRVPSPATEAPPPAIEVPPGMETARAYLARYYGERWPEIEKAMEASKAKLDVPFVCSEWDDVAFEFEQALCLKPEEVTAMAQRKLAWPDELTEEWLRKEYQTGRPYQLRPDDLPLIEDAVAALNDEIRAKAAQWAELVQSIIQNRWATGDLLRAPYTTQGLSKDVGFWSKSTGGHGWAVTLTLRREDHPDAAALESEIYDLRRRREETVVRYLHRTIGR